MEKRYIIKATIKVSGARSKKQALNQIQVMLDDYDSMNSDKDASICVHIEDIRKEDAPIFKQSIDLSDINDSMELDSGQTIATLVEGNMMAELRVVGDVRVLYKGEIYKHASSMPEDLIRIFHEGKASEAEQKGLLEIGCNNWFESFIYMKNAKGQRVWTGWSDVTDDEGSSPKEIRQGLHEYIDAYMRSL